jgi:NTE family protein
MSERVADPVARAAAPVEVDADESPDRKIEEGIGLCLSGGGYRAMLFHLGSLWRLNELAYLPRLDRVSSVSGGSITAGLLGLRWKDLALDPEGRATNFREIIVEPLRELARRRVDIRAILVGILSPGSIGAHVARAYSRHLLGTATLRDLPDRPRFVFNAANLQSGVLWRFSKPYMRDYRVGKVDLPSVPLATAVAASSAFPPFLSPVVLRLNEGDFEPGSGGELQRAPFTTRVALTDGGVYDNLGLETVWKRYRTVLVSDGGGRLGPEERPRHLWPLQLLRVLSVIDSQVRSLRKRQTIDGFKGKLRHGAYWGIRTNILDYKLDSALPCPHADTMRLAGVPTRLSRINEKTQEQLINWGYAVCDAAMRKHVEQTATPPAGFPYPAAAVA